VAFWRWRRAYSSHLTKRVMSYVGWISCPETMDETIHLAVEHAEVEDHVPIPKFFGTASKRGFFLVLVALLGPKGAAAGFLPFALGGWSLRRGLLAMRTIVDIAPRSSSVVRHQSAHDPAYRHKHIIASKDSVLCAAERNNLSVAGNLEKNLYISSDRGSSKRKTCHPSLCSKVFKM